MKIAIGSDHAGFKAKESAKPLLHSLGLESDDKGTHSAESTDYPDYALAVAEAVARGEADRGILFCSSGIGMSIVANKVPGIRAALCDSPEIARLSRQHNNANVLVVGSNFLSQETIEEIIQAFFASEFESGGRHERRVKKIDEIDSRRQSEVF